MKCPNCGNENNDSAKFCKNCGAKLTPAGEVKNTASQSDAARNKKIIITAVAVAVIILAGVVVYASGILTPMPPMQTQEFDQFTIDVPVGSKFVIGDQYTTDKKHIAVFYDNNGDYSDEVYSMAVGNSLSTEMIHENATLSEEYNDTKVYDFEGIHELYAEYDDSQLLLIGDNVKALKHMADSYKEGDISKLYSKTTKGSSSSSSSSQSQSSAPATTSMSILGGSFSTGGGLEDKTYASIYVGPEHAGEKVTIQIFYSRDGSTLNNGNMVPKTVTSSGYIEVRSADAYSKFPDFAEINLYDSSGGLLDSKSVSLNPDSGTQTF